MDSGLRRRDGFVDKPPKRNATQSAPDAEQDAADTMTAPAVAAAIVADAVAPTPNAVARLAVDVAAEKLAADIVMLDLRGLTVFADYFVIMTADSVRQIEALEEDLSSALQDAGATRHHREGAPASGWVLLDFADVVIHIFGPEEREFFGLERLWQRAPQVVRIL